jgi:hypothetical protein
MMPSNSFSRSDQRRRRLLADDLSSRNELTQCRAWSGNVTLPTSHYGDAAFLKEQIRLLDLIPRRKVVLVLMLFAAAAAIAGLEVGYSWMLDRAAHGAAVVAAFDLSAKASLGGWFSSLLLVAAAAVALLVYSVRRHRVDDYRGHYRIWFWAAACWFFLATDQAAGLRETLRDVMIAVTGTKLSGDGAIWWVVVYAVGLGAIGSRLLIDMWPAMFSMSLLVFAAFAQAAAVAVRLGLLPQAVDGSAAMYWSAAEMCGNLAILAAMTIHARYVLFDAEGLLPIRKSKCAEESLDDDGEDADGGGWVKIDPPHGAGTHQPVFQRASAPQNISCTAAATTANSSFQPSPVNRKLTKGERKALKERLLRERMERERKGLN